MCIRDRSTTVLEAATRHGEFCDVRSEVCGLKFSRACVCARARGTISSAGSFAAPKQLPHA
eukprot:2726761-Amphidinium_carterae.1